MLIISFIEPLTIYFFYWFSYRGNVFLIAMIFTSYIRNVYEKITFFDNVEQDK